MSGTPVLSTLTEGLAGTVPVALRGLLNATANFILTQMADGSSYQEALAGRSRRSPGRHHGPSNAVTVEAHPVGQVTIAGPGAGQHLAGQGVLSDIIAVASRRGTYSHEHRIWQP